MPDNNDSQSRLRTSVFAPKAATSTNGGDSPDTDLPDTSGPYQAFAHPANQPVYTLHCWLGKDGYRSFQYVHLDSDSSFQTVSAGHVIKLRFAGTEVMQITITGRKLWRLYDYLHQHRTAFIMQADREFADEQAAIITGIEIVAVSSPEPAFQAT